MQYFQWMEKNTLASSRDDDPDERIHAPEGTAPIPESQTRVESNRITSILISPSAPIKPRAPRVAQCRLSKSPLVSVYPSAPCADWSVVVAGSGAPIGPAPCPARGGRARRASTSSWRWARRDSTRKDVTRKIERNGGPDEKSQRESERIAYEKGEREGGERERGRKRLEKKRKREKGRGKLACVSRTCGVRKDTGVATRKRHAVSPLERLLSSLSYPPMLRLAFHRPDIRFFPPPPPTTHLKPDPTRRAKARARAPPCALPRPLPLLRLCQRRRLSFPARASSIDVPVPSSL